MLALKKALDSLAPTAGELLAIVPIVILAEHGEIPDRLRSTEPERDEPVIVVKRLSHWTPRSIFEDGSALPLISYCNCNLDVLWNIS